MFLCRHLLLRVHTLTRTPRIFYIRRHLSDSIALNSLLNHAHLSQTHDAAPATRRNRSKDPKKCSSDIPVEQLLDVVSHVPQYSGPNLRSQNLEEGKVKVEKKSIDTLDAYENLRQLDRSLVSNLPVSAYTRLAKKACQVRSKTTMEYLAADVVEIYQGNQFRTTQIIQSFLSMAAHQPILRHSSVLSLLRHLESFGSLSELAPKFLLLVTGTVTRRIPRTKVDHSLLAILSPLLVGLIHATPAPSGAAFVAYDPPESVETSFDLIRRLLESEQKQLALDLFQALVDTNNIPPEAVRPADGDSGDFKLIIQSALIRSCIHWSWRNRAAASTLELLQQESASRNFIASLSVDCVYALLDSPSQADVEASASIVARLLEIKAQVPHGLIRVFYDAARGLGMGNEAESLYHLTQSPRIRKREQYPLPQGRALSWLMRHLTLKSRNMHLARTLAEQVVERLEPIPIQDRAHFITAAAANGFAKSARALWERYASGEDRDMVVGNSAMIIRMIGLFANLINRTEAKLRGFSLVEVSGSKRGASGDEVDEESSRETLEARLADFKEFALRLLSEYRATKEPLSQASHFDLTSLARAYFLLGDFSAGFDSFKFFLNRKELPDIYDINVALSAMAEINPETAARTIERMVWRGIKPDAITFGTVLHHAIVQDKMLLVDTLISRARELCHEQLTLKSVSALIRASLSVEDDSITSVRSNLERALGVIRSLTNSSFVCTPNTGKFCISASLRADDPVIAYQFWKLLVRDKAEWRDRQHRTQRRQIAKMVRDQYKAGWLDAGRATVILSQLQEGGLNDTKTTSR